ncbi:hypothetical protein HK104_003211, partial [Borealophlyctis nickersoniae]
MLGDKELAKSTNVIPSGKVQDLYSEFIPLIQGNLDEFEGDDDFNNLSKIKVDREMVKRPIMTIPYAANVFGIKDQLKEKYGITKVKGYGLPAKDGDK